ncbi:MAG: SPOR domain-containing protein, partial [Nitrospinales bacterium]
VQQEIKGSFSVQVGSFKNIDSAIRLQRRLMYRGYPTYILTANISRKRRLWYRVYLGRFTSKRNAEIAAQRVRKEEKLNNVIHVAGK